MGAAVEAAGTDDDDVFRQGIARRIMPPLLPPTPTPLLLLDADDGAAETATPLLPLLPLLPLSIADTDKGA